MGDIEILFDVCWILSPSQIQKLISQYHNADYEAPISADILKAVAARVKPEDKADHLLLQLEMDEVGPYQLPQPREINGLETCECWRSEFEFWIVLIEYRCARLVERASGQATGNLCLVEPSPFGVINAFIMSFHLYITRARAGDHSLHSSTNSQ
jgi:myosin-5